MKPMGRKPLLRLLKALTLWLNDLWIFARTFPAIFKLPGIMSAQKHVAICQVC